MGITSDGVIFVDVFIFWLYNSNELGNLVIFMYEGNNDNNSGNGGFLSKFKFRLRLIRISRYRKLKNIKADEDDNKKFIEDTVKKIHDDVNKEKNISLKPRAKGISVVDGSQKRRVADNNNNNRQGENINPLGKDNGVTRERNIEDTFVNNKDKTEDKGFISNVIKNIRNTAGDRNYGRRYGIDGKKKVLDVGSVKKDEIEELKVKIINKIKRDFEKKSAELDVLESELYFISKENNSQVELDKVVELKKRIEDVIAKINTIIDQYNIYSANYELDDAIYIDDSRIVDDIINFKNIVDSYKFNESLAREYKLLDEFRNLYTKLDYVSEVAEGLVLDNQLKIDEFDVRDKKYDEIKRGVVNTDRVLGNCDLEIEKQNEYFKDLMSKINDIDKKEYTVYKFKGIDGLIGQSFKYISLLFMSPLAGLIPSIAINTLATRKMIKNIYSKMHIERLDKVKYEAYNYEREISSKLNDLDYTYALIDDTIGIIDNLKSDFMLQYDSSIPGYDATLRKINGIRDKVRDNRYKMDIIKDNLVVSKKINDDKMKKVRELNNE